ncbi:MAG: AAA family ATPase [Candidatus Promineifilaceae bacterium]|nr:AAA family ATPase [Candidatus Promineifilaceae bacterium]
MDLFAHGRKAEIERESPLANRMRPRTLDEFVGQEHIVGPGRLLRRAIQADQLSSLIFYGPPGTGKTTLAMVIANTTESHFITINAVLSGVAQIRQAISDAQERRNLYGQRTTLFVDEVHRWNKAQQDALLPHVENGTVILIGATTENPYFEVNKALVSRSRIFQLKPLTEADLYEIAEAALGDPERGYGQLDVVVTPEALDHLVDVANGDARGVLNALELAVETTTPAEDGSIIVDLTVAEESIQRRAVLYDKEGDVHYDTISAFIKSLRGSDPDAALYWMAKMVYAGEDPRFIFRRMAILAGEDVGLADPNAAVVVGACWDLFEKVGMPEGRFHLAEAALYLATCPKSNSTLAFFDALTTVEHEREQEVPTHLRDGNRDSEGFGHGQGYLYPHAYRDHWVAQQYLPVALQGKLFYEPSDQGYERQIQAQVARRREEQLAAMVERDWSTPEGLTTGPSDRSRDAWLQRAVASSGRQLGQIRERIFELAAVQRHELLLDLNAGSGLLTWEAVRQIGEGGVWALASDPADGEALRQMATRLPELERPQVLIGRLEELDYLLTLRNEDALRFDIIVGRNPLTAVAEEPIGPTRLATLIRPWLQSGGRLVVAQVVPRHSQRLYDLVDWTTAPEELAAQVRQAEEAIYNDSHDPMVNWDVADLASAFEEAGFQRVETQRQPTAAPRRITVTQVARWFEPGEERPSYGERLAEAGLSPATVEQVADLYRRQLVDAQVEWRTINAYLTAQD